MIVAKQGNTYQFEAPLRTARRCGQGVQRLHKKVIGPMAQIALAGLVIALLLLAYVTEKNVVMSYTYQLDELESQLGKAMTQRDRLSLEVLGLQSLDRVDSVARAKLGMVQPTDVRYVALAPIEETPTLPAGSERVVSQVAEYISGLFTSVVKAAGLYEGR